MKNEHKGLRKVLKHDINNENSEKISVIDLIKENNEFDSTLGLIVMLDKLIDNFESKDIIPKNMAKAYALLSRTNKVQKDNINAIISKKNDNKGNTKKMYFSLIKETIKSLKQNVSDNEKNGFFNKFSLNRNKY